MQIHGMKDRKRREVLQTLGSAALALPFLHYFEPRAKAAGPRQAKFIVFIYTANGTDPENFFPTGGETNFTLSPILQPLAAFKDKLLILGPQSSTVADGTGLAHDQELDPSNPDNSLRELSHQTHVCLTGDGKPHSQVANGQYGLTYPCRGPSMDQLIASKIYPTAVPSLQLGVHSVGQQGSCTLSFTLEGSPMRRETDPRAVWSQIFGTPVGGMVDPSFTALQQRRMAVSNFLNKRFSALLKSKRLGTADRAALDHHLTAIRQTEDMLFNPPKQEPGANCKQPSFQPVPAVRTVDPAHRSPNDSDATPADYVDIPALTANMMEVITSAFACDLTRVAALSTGWEGAGDGIRASWVGVDEGQHALSHYDPSMMPQGRDHWNRLDNWFAGQLAGLLDRLQSTPYGAGNLLDQTIVYWLMRHGHGGGHENERLGNVIAGGAGGYFRMGRFLRLPRTNHNQLLVSLANAMGVDIPRFGITTPATAPLAGLT